MSNQNAMLVELYCCLLCWHVEWILSVTFQLQAWKKENVYIDIDNSTEQEKKKRKRKVKRRQLNYSVLTLTLRRGKKRTATKEQNSLGASCWSFPRYECGQSSAAAAARTGTEPTNRVVRARPKLQDSNCICLREISGTHNISNEKAERDEWLSEAEWHVGFIKQGLLLVHQASLQHHGQKLLESSYLS